MRRLPTCDWRASVFPASTPPGELVGESLHLIPSNISRNSLYKLHIRHLSRFLAHGGILGHNKGILCYGRLALEISSFPSRGKIVWNFTLREQCVPPCNYFRIADETLGRDTQAWNLETVWSWHLMKAWPRKVSRFFVNEVYSHLSPSVAICPYLSPSVKCI